jgi:hypothetical protein
MTTGIVKMVNHKKERKDNSNKNFLIILGVVLGIVILVSLVVWVNQSNSQSNNADNYQSNTNTQNAQVNSPAKSCTDVQVPYQDSEPYTAQQCHQENLKYAMLDKQCESVGVLGLSYKITCTIDNLDTEGGDFIMEAGGTKVHMNGNQEDYTQNIGGYFYPGETKSYAYVFNTGLQSCWCKIVSVPQKQVCEDVTNYRTVTKYRTEQQCN